MKRVLIIATFLLTLLSVLGGLSPRPEKYLMIEVNHPSEIENLTSLCSIDKVDGNLVYAYALPDEVIAVRNSGYRYETIPFPYQNTRVSMATTVAQMDNWDLYPTFSVFNQMVLDLATDYPNICQAYTIGNSVQNRAIYMLKISDNVASSEAEPEVYYTGTMHGDETLCYVALLRLAYEICEGYGTDTELTDMVNNMEIYINPLSNPDGTFYGGENSIDSSRRYNYNNVDLNRNFIDPDSNTNGDGNATAIENTHQMNFASSHNFVLSANFHSGAEVVNYPWDTWSTRHIDDTWYQYVSRNYATSVQNLGPTDYFDDQTNGITNGYDWYTTDGCRQDWMNYFQYCREVTIELSNTKILPDTDLDAYYGYNRQSLLNFLKEANYGIQGIITDIDGNPLEAEISINNHDDAQSTVWSASDNGDYYRPIAAGNYEVTVSVTGYDDQVFNSIIVTNGQATILNATFGTLGGTQDINLSTGWNLISLNATADDMNPEVIFASIASNVIQVKNLTQTYDPSMPEYFNTLTVMDNAEAYWVNMSNPETLSITGTIADDTQVISLNSGWNMLGYCMQAALAPETALQNILSDLIQIKNLTQTYDPSMPSYFNTLTQMEPGIGYWINMQNSANLLYNSTTRVIAEGRDDAYWNPTVYPNNTATAYITLPGVNPQAGDLLGAFNNDECLGTANITVNNIDAYATMVIQVPENGTVINFRYHNIITDVVDEFDGELIVNSSETYTHTLATTDIDDNVVPADNYISVYPNPFNPMTGECTINSKQANSNWKIYNLKGQLVSELKESNTWNGKTVNGKSCPEGIYFIRNTDDNSSKIEKLILMK
ncbi:MAG: M14 family zinc carboxypeptidase [Candidatus Zophobacter franzmannii]|nr:M14 family zinc carboxypeptidase [Candidatus Zophobacter franzmannii]